MTGVAPDRSLPRISRSRLAALAIVWIMASYAIALSHAQLFEPESVRQHTTAYHDPQRYVGMVQGESPGGHWHYRVLVPAMARVIPDGPLRAISSRRDATDAWIASVKLRFVNVLFLTLTAATLYVLLLTLAFSPVESLLGTFLFFTAMPVLQAGGVPSVDPASWFFFVLAALALRLANAWLFGVTVAVGMLAKESMIFVLPLVLLATQSWRTRGILLLAAAPGILLYLGVRFLWFPVGGDYLPAAASGVRGVERALRFVASVVTRPNRLIDLFSSFGLLWIPAVHAYARGDGTPQLRRWALFVPLLALAILYFGLNLGRILFLAFPIVLPFAMLGLRRWWTAGAGATIADAEAR